MPGDGHGKFLPYTMQVLVAVSMLILASTAVLARAQQGQWLAPGPLCATYWSLACAAPLLILGDGYISGRSVLAIAVGTAVLTLGTCLALARRGRGANLKCVEPRRVPHLHRATLRYLVLAGTASGLTAAVLAVYTHGLKITNAFSLEGLLQTGNALSLSRYGDNGTDTSTVVAALLGITYAAAVVSPFTLLDRESTSWRRTLVAAPALAALAYSTITTEHLAMLLCAAMTTSGYLAMCVLRDGMSPALSRSRVMNAGVIGGIVAVAFVAISFVRVGSFESNVRPVIFDKIEVYAVGYLPAFSGWLDARLDGHRPTDQLGYGTSSLPAVGALVGQSRASTRSYDERVTIGPDGQTTNVYSWWRNFILDFDLPGAALALVLFGWMMGRIYLAVVLRASISAAAGLACCFSVVLLSNTYTITTFTNVSVAFAIAIWLLVRSSRVMLRLDLNSYVGQRTPISSSADRERADAAGTD